MKKVWKFARSAEDVVVRDLSVVLVSGHFIWNIGVIKNKNKVIVVMKSPQVVVSIYQHLPKCTESARFNVPGYSTHTVEPLILAFESM